MPTPRLPKTSIRLSTSISLFVLREDAISLETFFKAIFSPRATVDEIQRQMKPISGIVSLYEDQSRDMEHRYEIDSNVRGEPLEVFGSPVRRTLKLRRAVFYKDDLIKVLGYDEELRRAGTEDAGLLSQSLKKPLILIKREIAPEGSGIAPIITFYRGCLIGSITRDTTVAPGQVLGIFEDANIYYAGRQQFTAA